MWLLEEESVKGGLDGRRGCTGGIGIKRRYI